MPEKINYKRALDLVRSLYFTGIKPGLENTLKLLSLVDNPQNDLCFIHIAGTNGKGSVSSMTESGLREAGLTTGLFTSPHLISIRERFRVNEKEISKAEFSRLAFFLFERTRHLYEHETDQKPTFFEFITVLAILFFKERNVDIAIMEVGMGGRLDSTNVIHPLLSIITAIGLDHTKLLGPKIENIAFEKAGIIKSGIPVICGERDKRVQNVISEIARDRNAPVYFIGRDFKRLKFNINNTGDFLTQDNLVKWKDKKFRIKTKLVGQHQCLNVSIATAAFAVLNENNLLNIKLSEAINGIKKTEWPGRLDTLKNGLLVDTAHNLAAITQTIHTVKTVFPNKKWTVLFAVLNDKKWKRMITKLIPLSREICLVSINHRNQVNPADIEQFIAKKRDTRKITVFQDIPKAIRYILERGNGIALGSSYLIGEVISASNGKTTFPNDR